MSDQFDLFGTPEAPSNPMEAKFWTFVAENPEVYVEFDRHTKRLIRRGLTHYSADAVMHVVRFETSLRTTDKVWKLNNNHIAYFARLWIRNNPKHKGFFRFRDPRNGEVSAALKTEAA